MIIHNIMPLPKNYEFAPWVLQSKQAKPKAAYIINPESIGWNALDYLKVAKPDKSITFTDEASYANYITKTKENIKSFNYTYQDETKIRSNIVLDLHDESNTVEKLDKLYDIRDGFVV